VTEYGQITIAAIARAVTMPETNKEVLRPKRSAKYRRQIINGHQLSKLRLIDTKAEHKEIKKQAKDAHRHSDQNDIGKVQAGVRLKTT
jgi:hypothetical protein